MNTTAVTQTTVKVTEYPGVKLAGGVVWGRGLGDQLGADTETDYILEQQS